MPTIKLTDAAVQKLKAGPGQRVDYFDAGQSGFGVRVAGAKPPRTDPTRSWFAMARIHGELKRMTLGRYPAMSLAEARAKAADLRLQIERGGDPAAEMAAEKKAARAPKAAPDTLASTVEDFLTRGLEKKNRAEGYIAETRRLFANHVLPRWADRALGAIARRDVIEMLDDIAENGTTRRIPEGKRHAEGGPIAANRTLSAVRAFYNWAIRRGIVESNPCSLVERPGAETKRERTLSSAELREIWPTFGQLGYPFGPYFQIVLLTGQRRTEVATMRWQDLDLDEKTWTLSSEQTKAGRSHVVPLSDAAVAILRTLVRKTAQQPNGLLRPSPWVFTTNGDASISGFSKAKEIVDRAVTATRRQTDRDAAELQQWGIHDLRRTAATEMGRLGTPEFIIGKVLNHSSAGITGQVYNRYEYLAEKRHALDMWAAYLTNLTQPPAANVVQRRAAS